MRWPRMARTPRTKPSLDVPRHDSTDDTIQDTSLDDLALKSDRSNDPGLSRMFNDAALYEQVLNACPESLQNASFFVPDGQALPSSVVCGFNELIGRDLDDAGRAITGKLAKLSVNNWTSSSKEDPFGSESPSEEEPGEEASSSDDAEDEKQTPLSEPQSLDEDSEPSPPSEPKLTPEEIVDLLEQEFGALAPPGEEKLLLETDAAFFKDVVVLVRLLPPLLCCSARLTFFFFLATFRVSFTSLRIGSLSMLHSYPPNTLRKLSSLAQY
jgi:sterol 3beta-glucosyltransferase